jgi:hypothetical protein
MAANIDIKALIRTVPDFEKRGTPALALCEFAGR